MYRHRRQSSAAAARQGGGGFSLIELILVVAIIAVFCAMAMPKFNSAGQAHRATLAARKLAADLAWVQAAARSRNTAATLTLNANNTYTLAGVATSGTIADLTVNLADAPFACQLGTVSLTQTSDSSATRVISFDTNGIPSAAGTIIVMTNTSSKTVTISSPGGAITIQ